MHGVFCRLLLLPPLLLLVLLLSLIQMNSVTTSDNSGELQLQLVVWPRIRWATPEASSLKCAPGAKLWL